MHHLLRYVFAFVYSDQRASLAGSLPEYDPGRFMSAVKANELHNVAHLAAGQLLQDLNLTKDIPERVHFTNCRDVDLFHSILVLVFVLPPAPAHQRGC